MANQHVNKVAVNGKTVLDLSGDTVYPGMLAKGITAHDKSGAKITGTLTVPGEETRYVELDMQYGSQYIVASTGMLMKQVEITKPSTFLPENIKKGVNIGGIVGTLETGDPTEAWIIRNDAPVSEGYWELYEEIDFESNGTTYGDFVVTQDGQFVQLLYSGEVVASFDSSAGQYFDWNDPGFRRVTFATSPTGDLMNWLAANAIRQGSNVVVQESKSVTISSNGTTTIKPSTPYDALMEVDVTVDVASGGITWYSPVS